MIRFTIPGRPITKKNHQQICRSKSGKPFVRQAKRYTDYETAAGYFIPCKNLGIDYPVNVKCLYYMPDRRRVDLVNLLEATDDILVKYGVLKDDNSDIVFSHDGSRVFKRQGDARVEIEITEETDEESRAAKDV